MSIKLDLSFLTEEEIRHLRTVLERAKLLEDFHNEQKKNGILEVTSDDVIRIRWQESHKIDDGSYVTARDLITEALNEQCSLKQVLEEKGEENVVSPEIHSDDVITENKVQESWLMKKLKRKKANEIETSNDSNSDKLEDEPVPKPRKPSRLAEDNANTLLELANSKPAQLPKDEPKVAPLASEITMVSKDSKTDTEEPIANLHVPQLQNGDIPYTNVTENDSTPSSKSSESTANADSRVSPKAGNSTADPTPETSPRKSGSDQNDNVGEESRDQLTPLPSDSPLKTDSTPSPLQKSAQFDSKSMVSRTSVTALDFVGEVEVSLIYYPPSSVLKTKFPPNGTRFPSNENLDVLSRRHYVTMTASKLDLDKNSKCGASSEDDGELHLLVKGANDLRLPTAVRNKARTYAKCYMLPDRYHGCKMRSEIVKDTQSPRYNHKFVFRGFSEAEFTDRCVELVIGGVTSAHGRHLVVGGIRLSDGSRRLVGKNAPGIESRDDEINLWNQAFAEPSTEVSAVIQLSPHIKLTYK